MDRKHVIDYAAMGQRMRTARKNKKLSQADIASAVGISTSLVGHIERGIKHPSLATMAAICTKLEMDFHYLVFGFKHIPNFPSDSIHETAANLIDLLTEFLRKTD